MKDILINSSLNIIQKNKTCSESDLKIYKYGLEGIYNLVTKIMVIMIVTFYLNLFKEFILLLIFYALLRTFGYGIHAKGKISCWISTLIIYIGGAFLVKHLIISKSLVTLVLIIGFISFALWAPADTPKRPLIKKEKRLALKFRICFMTFVYLIVIYFTTSQIIINGICLALVLESLCINPLVYKILSTQFSNYKYYKKSLN